jgi:hypothetical protein
LKNDFANYKDFAPTVLSSGFETNSTNHAQSELDAPTILGLDNGQTTQLILRMQPVANAKSYEVQTKNGGGWTPAGVFAQTRGIVLPGLTPGQNYSVQRVRLAAARVTAIGATR